MPNERRAARAADSSLILGRQKFLTLSRQMNETYVKLDQTFVHTLRLTADMIETAHVIGLEPEKGQKLFQGLTACTDGMMMTRGNLIAAHLEATRIRMRTDQAETADGCPPPPWGEVGDGLRIVAEDGMRVVA